MVGCYSKNVLSKTVVENFFLLVGESFWFFAGASQLRHVIKSGNTKGLSAVSVTLNAAGNIAWIVYFVGLNLWFPVVTNALVLSVTIPLIGFILADRRKFYSALGSIAAIGPTTSYILIKFTSVSGWLAMSYNWIAGTPQIIKVIQHKKITGFSEHSIWMVIVATTSVIIYGSLIGALPLIVGGIQGIIYELVVVYHYYRYRHN